MMMDYLDVAIGLLVFYSLMSMIASAVVEAYSSSIRLRGRILKQAVLRFCCGFEKAADLIYRTPEVRSLTKSDEVLTTLGRSGQELPSEIPPETFTRAATRVLLSGGDEQRVEGKGATHPEKIVDLETEFDEAARGWAAMYPKNPEMEALGSYIHGVVVQAGNDVALFERLLVQHFNDVNQRASGWYRRKITRYLFVSGFIMAFFVNADSIMMLQRLVASEELRRDAISLVEKLQDPNSTDSENVEPEATSKPAASGSGDDNGEAATEPGSPPAANPAQQDLTRMLAEVESMSGGLGGLVKQGQVAYSVGYYALILFLIGKIAGLLLTAFAISLGSKFWFDLLSKVVSLRNSLSSSKLAEIAPGVVQGEGEGILRLPEIGMVGEPYRPRPRASVESLREMEEAAWISAAAYMDKANVLGAIGGSLSYEMVKDLASCTKTLVDTQCFVLREVASGRLIVAFRGSEKKLGDWVTNATFKLVPVESKGDSLLNKDDIRVHKGFQAALADVWNELRKVLLNENEPENGRIEVDFCGHSLGGALAVMAAVRFMTEQQEAEEDDPIRRLQFHRLLTIGQPRVGNDGFCRLVDNLTMGGYIRAVNDGDIVPRVPLASMGFRHTGTLHYFTQGGTLLVDPSYIARGFDQFTAIERASLEKRKKEYTEDHQANDYITFYTIQLTRS